MSRPDIDNYYLAMLPLVASRATCPRRQVAAILVDSSGKLVSIGYNGSPSGMAHCTDVPCAGAGGVSGDTSKCIAIHAEMNAVEQASASRRFPCTLYCSTTPCFECAKMLITKSITRVVAASSYPNQQGADLLRQAGVRLEVRLQIVKPTVVCLCGSTKFKAEFEEAERTETWAGKIVLTVGFFGHADGLVFTPEQKATLDELHKRKIDLSDEILVLNVEGYIGESTRSEIAYAMVHGKVIKYLEAV